MPGLDGQQQQSPKGNIDNRWLVGCVCAGPSFSCTHCTEHLQYSSVQYLNLEGDLSGSITTHSQSATV